MVLQVFGRQDTKSSLDHRIQSPGIKALSFVDDMAWLTEGKSEDSLSTKLESSPGAGRRKRGNLRHGQDRGDCPEQEKKNRPGRRLKHCGLGEHSLLQ